MSASGGGLAKSGSHLDKLLDQGWSLLLYPEGTRSRSGGTRRVKRGAAVLAANHKLSIAPIRLTGARAGDATGPVLAEAAARAAGLKASPDRGLIR